MGEEINSQNWSQYSGLALAYIGDAVYDLMVRERVLKEGNRQVTKMHHETILYVNAAAQADLIESVMDRLTEEEMTIYRRGRNSTSHTIPKNQSVTDYRKATGFEAVVGFLYLNGRTDRIEDLFFNNKEE